MSAEQQAKPAKEPGLDPVIHAPARLRIVAALGPLPAGDGLTFSRLQSLLGLTGGNLITHLRRLEDAGYVRSHRSPRGRPAGTAYALTPTGRQALAAYRASLAAILGEI